MSLYRHSSSQPPLLALGGGSWAWSQGWRPLLKYLCPAVPAQPCPRSDTRSTVLVSGSQSPQHHCLLAKTVPVPVWLLLLYLLRAAWVSSRECGPNYILHLKMFLFLATDSKMPEVPGPLGFCEGSLKVSKMMLCHK